MIAVNGNQSLLGSLHGVSPLGQVLTVLIAGLSAIAYRPATLKVVAVFLMQNCLLLLTLHVSLLVSGGLAHLSLGDLRLLLVLTQVSPD